MISLASMLITKPTKRGQMLRDWITCRNQVPSFKVIKPSISTPLMIVYLKVEQIKSIGGFWGEWKTGIPTAKTLGKEWTSNELRRLLTPSLGVKRRTNWWEASAQKDAPVPLPPLSSPHPSTTTVGNRGTRDKRVLSPLLIWIQRVVLCFEWC